MIRRIDLKNKVVSIYSCSITVMSILIDLFIEEQYQAKRNGRRKNNNCVLFLILPPSSFRYESAKIPPTLGKSVENDIYISMIN